MEVEAQHVIAEGKEASASRLAAYWRPLAEIEDWEERAASRR